MSAVPQFETEAAQGQATGTELREAAPAVDIGTQRLIGRYAAIERGGYMSPDAVTHLRDLRLEQRQSLVKAGVYNFFADQSTQLRAKRTLQKEK